MSDNDLDDHDYEDEDDGAREAYEQLPPPKPVIVVTLLDKDGKPLTSMVQLAGYGQTYQMMANAWATGPDMQPQLIQLPIAVEVRLA